VLTSRHTACCDDVTLSPVASISDPATDKGCACRAKPSAFLFLGIKNETVGSVYGLHNSKFKLDQTALKTGAAMHAALASEWLKTHAAAKEQSDEL
jgi:metal-dependent amidase/aminoacylase/carboxypeptidase family protein